MAFPPREKQYRTRKEIMDDPESPEMYEVVSGEVYIPRDFRFPHANAKSGLLVTLFRHVDDNHLGEVLPGPLDVVIDEEQSVQPDIVFVSNEHREIITDLIYGPPDLVIEAAAPNTSSRDKVLKTRVYRDFGVPNYWIVDPGDQTLMAFELVEGKYTRAATAGGDEEFEPFLFPGLTIELSKLWE